MPGIWFQQSSVLPSLSLALQEGALYSKDLNVLFLYLYNDDKYYNKITEFPSGFYFPGLGIEFQMNIDINFDNIEIL